MSEIHAAFAREILDSRGNPALEVEVELESGVVGRASVPSEGGSAALRELRDGDRKRCRGLGLLRAIDAVEEKISPELEGRDPADQLDIDRLLAELDGTPNCEKLGANVMLGVSLAVARAAADELGMPLYRALGGPNAKVLPVPMISLLDGAAAAGQGSAFRELMIRPSGLSSFREAVEAAMEIRHRFRAVLDAAGIAPATGAEGAFAPAFPGGCAEAIETLLKAVDLAGYRPGREISLAIDLGADAFFRNGAYESPADGGENAPNRTTEQQLEYLDKLSRLYPIDSIIDGVAAADRDGWRGLTDRLGDRCRPIGGSLFAAGAESLPEGIRDGLAAGALIKPVLCGTVTAVLDAVEIARRAGYAAVLSRSFAETGDAAIADLAVAAGTGEIAPGPLNGPGALAKYDQLLRIEEELGEFALYGA